MALTPHCPRPAGKADIRFTFPVLSEVEEELRLNFNWMPARCGVFSPPPPPPPL